jgi:hypothetical protein
MDVWTDKPQRRSYLCITAHWIGRSSQTKNLALRNNILAFHRLPHDSHHGKGMAKMVIHLLDRAEVTSKVCTHYPYSWSEQTRSNPSDLDWPCDT